MEQLVGALVRDAARRGRILAEDGQQVSIRWFKDGQIADETVPKDSSTVEVLTLKEGWMSIADLSAPQSPTVEDLMAELHSILDEAKAKSRRQWLKRGVKQMSPYKNQSTIGVGPNKEFGQRVVSQKIAWDCNRIGPYKQRCVGKDASGKRYVKIVTIKKSYKKKYNKTYKAWVASKKKKG